MYVYRVCFFFCFKQKTAYEMRISDWSSDVCSSDLEEADAQREDGGIGDHAGRRKVVGDGREAGDARHDDHRPTVERAWRLELLLEIDPEAAGDPRRSDGADCGERPPSLHHRTLQSQTELGRELCGERTRTFGVTSGVPRLFT